MPYVPNQNHKLFCDWKSHDLVITNKSFSKKCVNYFIGG